MILIKYCLEAPTTANPRKNRREAGPFFSAMARAHRAKRHEEFMARNQNEIKQNISLPWFDARSQLTKLDKLAGAQVANNQWNQIPWCVAVDGREPSHTRMLIVPKLNTHRQTHMGCACKERQRNCFEYQEQIE